MHHQGRLLDRSRRCQVSTGTSTCPAWSHAHSSPDNATTLLMRVVDIGRVLPNCIAKAKGERSLLVGAAVLRTPDLSSLTVGGPSMAQATHHLLLSCGRR